MRDEDRYLQRRGKRWHYVRRVPTGLEAHYSGVLVRRSLKTSDLAEARLRRDAHEEADEAYWSELRLGGLSASTAERRYNVAVKRASALRYEYKSAIDLAAHGELSDILARIEELSGLSNPKKVDADALLGRVDEPDVKLMDAFKVLCDEIRADYLSAKDEEGRKVWEQTKLRSINTFIDLYGDRPINDIDRDLARKFFNHLKDRITGQSGKQITGNTAKRYMGDIRSLLEDYWKHVGEDRQNPFAGFSFADKRKKRRLPLRVDQIDNLFLTPGAFQKTKRESRLLVYMMIETGARLSELATLRAEDFRLDHDVPHFLIYEREGRSLKTENSNRIMPLCGVALEAAKLVKEDDGFPHYRPRRKTLLSALNKFCRENGFFETGQSVYSLRHSFEDRLKDAHVDAEMRKYLMGHGIGREEYGGYGSMELKQDAIQRIVRPFDPAIIADIS